MGQTLRVPTITVDTSIHAPQAVVFDAARDIALHCRTTDWTGERAVAGVTHGLIGLGESVTFEAVHFGVRQRLTGQVVEMEIPHRFVDVMLRGAFAELRHTHEFLPEGTGTIMRDTLEWRAPLGPLGRLADALFLVRYMTKFLVRRGTALKSAVEASGP